MSANPAQRAKLARRIATAPLLPTEEQEQEAVFAWALMRQNREPRLALLHASMNGILTNAAFGAKLKRLGRKRGIPDISLDIVLRAIDGNIVCPGLRIELKRIRGGVVSSDQAFIHEQLRLQGYRVEICRGADAAIATIESYLRG